MQQVLLQNVTAILLQNAIEVYYKMRQLLQIATILLQIRQLLQSATFIPNSDSTQSYEWNKCNRNTESYIVQLQPKNDKHIRQATVVKIVNAKTWKRHMI